VHLRVLIVVELENVFLDDKFKQADDYISTEGTFEGLHDPKEFQEFQ
jgi:hypothetical protein